MNYIELQRMRKAAGLGWGWVNDLVGDDNFVSDIFGNDRYDRLNNQANQFRQQMNEDLGPEAIQRQQQGAADWDRRVAEAGNHLDYRLAAAQQAAEQQRQRQIAQQQAAASKRNENLMAAYMAGNNQQLTSQIGNVRQRNYQAFNRNNLSGYTQDQINAINAAAQKKGLKMGDITQVSFNDKGAVNGFRVRKGTLNQQPQNTAIANAPATQAPTTRKT